MAEIRAHEVSITYEVTMRTCVKAYSKDEAITEAKRRLFKAVGDTLIEITNVECELMDNEEG